MLGAAALAAVVVAGAAWGLTGGDEPDDKDGAAAGNTARVTPSGPVSPAAATSASASAPAGDGLPTDAPASASASSSAPAGGGYTPLFENKPLTLRAPSPMAYTYVDLDLPKIHAEGGGPYPDGIELTYNEFGGSSTLSFLTTTGISEGTTAEQCAAAADTNALPATITGKKDLLALLPEGTVLCTVTKDGNLAMLKITKVETRVENIPDYTTELTLWKPS
ncbi:hypothetical protein L1856_03865 [Streptomyces sp. Tue 6430]|nr:hypothetical protein [Streptomyces sp. Tue 6430]